MFFKQRPVVIEAVKWDGRNVGKIAQLLGNENNYKVSGDMISINGEMVICKDQYLMRDMYGNLMISNSKAFERNYYQIGK